MNFQHYLENVVTSIFEEGAKKTRDRLGWTPEAVLATRWESKSLQPEMQMFCETNCKSRYTNFDYYDYWFESEADAAMFKLAFGDWLR